jgi:TolB protein
MHPTEVRSRLSRRTVALLWMASSLAFAGCGEAGGAEASGGAEPYATESQRLDESGDEGVSSDRRIIVYQTPSLQLYAVDKKGRTELLAERSGAPVLSPDGRQVAYAKLPDSWQAGNPVTRAELHVYDTRSGHSERVTRGNDDTEPVWTPDGRSLLFQSTKRSGMASLWKVKETGIDLEQVTNENCTGSSPAYIPNPLSSETVEWDADRRIIVYSTTSLTNGDVRVIRFDRALNVEAAYSLGVGYAPKWTDHGTVVFQRNVNGQVVTIEVSVD